MVLRQCFENVPLNLTLIYCGLRKSMSVTNHSKFPVDLFLNSFAESGVVITRISFFLTTINNCHVNQNILSPYEAYSTSTMFFA